MTENCEGFSGRIHRVISVTLVSIFLLPIVILGIDTLYMIVTGAEFRVPIGINEFGAIIVPYPATPGGVLGLLVGAGLFALLLGEAISAALGGVDSG